MKILGLKIEGLRKIKAAELDLSSGNLVQIRGRNQAGKSTILLAIEMLFGGKAIIPDDVITHGKEKAQIIAKVDDFIIKRIIKQNGNHFLAISKEDMTRKKPQEFLNTIAGGFLDPQLFSKLSGLEMKKKLMQHLGIDFQETDEKIRILEIKRRDIGRDRKAQGEPVSVDPVEPVNLSDLLEERKKIDAYNKLQDEKANNIKVAQSEIEKIESEKIQKLLIKDTAIAGKKDLIEEYKKKIKELLVGIDSLEKAKEEITAQYEEPIQLAYEKKADLPTPEKKKPVDELEEKIDNAEKINKRAAEYQTYIDKKATCEKMDADYNQCTADIRALQDSKETRLREAKMPISGLMITETGLSIDGITNENWSDSQSLMVAMHISAALSKQLKTIFIRRGESLDSASLAEVERFANENDFQVIIEIVDDTYSIDKENVIYIEEGQIINIEKSGVENEQS